MAESYLPLIPSLPLYAWARLFAHGYLLLPGASQGAGFIYSTYLCPFIREHEREIESLIEQAHAVARDFGLGHLEALWEYVKTNVLGQPPSRRDPAADAARAPPASNSFVASLLGRFTAPTPAGAGPQAGLSALLGSALAQASNLTAAAGAGTGSATRDVHRDALIPAHLSSDGERLAYIKSQREHLRTLLGAFDREEQTINLASVDGSSGMGRSRSENEFETIRSEDAGPPPGVGGRASSGSWGAWIVGKGKEAAREAATSSGVDVRR